jgi:hypothetical protein
VTNNPLLVLSGDGSWRLATNSPVLGAAAGSYLAVTNDFDGQARLAVKDSCGGSKLVRTRRFALGTKSAAE